METTATDAVLPAGPRRSRRVPRPRVQEIGARLAPDGSAAGDRQLLDGERLIGTHLAIQGNSGAGKSRTIRKLLELTHGGPQHIVLDVEDEFYTLRQRFAYVIAGGEFGDCPARVDNAAEFARVLLETGVSAIVQINDLPLSERRAFIRLFLEAMIGAPRSLWHPTLVVLDEADRYAPQDGSAESLSAVVALMAQGRKRGYTGVLATQRLAKIAKDCTGDVNNWLMGRVGQSADRRAVADALGFRPASVEARGLVGLEPGCFWGFRPALSPEPVLLRVGPVVTTHLRGGESHLPTPPAPHELRALLQRLRRPVAEAVGPEDTAVPACDTMGAAQAHQLDALLRRVRELEADPGVARGAAEQARAAQAEAQGRLDGVRAIVIDERWVAPGPSAASHRARGSPRAGGDVRPREKRRTKMTARSLARARARRLLADPARTVEEVARRLGVGTATLYRHLPGGRYALAEQKGAAA